MLREQIRKAEADVERDRRRIENARVLTPLGGLVSILENRSGRRSFGQSSPPVQEGDDVQPGMAMAQILDLSEMELAGQVEEVERARLREGQDAIIYLDALPGQAVKGKIKRLGSTASANFFRGQATKKFACVLSVDMTELLTEVGASPEQIRAILASGKAAAAAAESRLRAARRPAATKSINAGSPAVQAGSSGKSAKSPRGGRGKRSPEERERARKMMQELAGGRDLDSMSQEERRRIFQQMRSRAGGDAARGGGDKQQLGQSNPGRQRSPGQPGAGAPPEIPSLSPPSPGNSRFTPSDREAARLPEPPQEGSVVEVLLRPGLLADAEIVVERIPDTLHVPMQAVYPSGENNIVYVWDGNDLESRRVEVGQRTETRIAILSGLEEGETVSLRPPADQRQTTKKKKSAKKSGPSLPGGPADRGEGGGGRGGRGGERGRQR